MLKVNFITKEIDKCIEIIAAFVYSRKIGKCRVNPYVFRPGLDRKNS